MKTDIFFEVIIERSCGSRKIARCPKRGTRPTVLKTTGSTGKGKLQNLKKKFHLMEIGGDGVSGIGV